MKLASHLSLSEKFSNRTSETKARPLKTTKVFFAQETT
jgi:hypothetical protein